MPVSRIELQTLRGIIDRAVVGYYDRKEGLRIIDQIEKSLPPPAPNLDEMKQKYGVYCVPENVTKDGNGKVVIKDAKGNVVGYQG